MWLAVLCSAAKAGRPTVETSRFDVTTAINTDRFVELRARISIPDNDELSWAINVPNENITVRGLRVELRGLHHERATDLLIRLQKVDEGATRGSRSRGATLFDGPRSNLGQAGRQITFGRPSLGENSGLHYTFTDLLSPGSNMALNRAAYQSSTVLSAAAGRAVDGDTSGVFSRRSTTHTRSHTVHPWWFVDLGETRNVSSVRIWGPEQEDDIAEVQIIEVTSADSAAFRTGTFKLSYASNVTGHFETFETRAIACNAAASITDVPGGSLSVQAALDEVLGAGAVKVHRTVRGEDAGGKSAFTWTVTFKGVNGNVGQLVPIANASSLGALDASLTVRTLRHGSSSLYWKRWSKLQAVWLAVLPASLSPNEVAALSASNALGVALWKQRVVLDPPAASVSAGASNAQTTKLRDASRREITTLLRSATQVAGRYVYIQAAGVHPASLTISEVEVFGIAPPTLWSYTGGSPLPSGVYQSRQDLGHTFARSTRTDAGASPFYDEGVSVWEEEPHTAAESATAASADTVAPSSSLEGITSAKGTWILSIADLVPGATGALDDWVLYITTQHNETLAVRPRISAIVKTLPTYGALCTPFGVGWSVNASAAIPDSTRPWRGTNLTSSHSQRQINAPCYGGRDCAHRFGVGPHLSTNTDGSVATTRIIDGARSIIYMPRPGWSGSEAFSYSIIAHSSEIGGNDEAKARKTRGEVTVHVKSCRASRDSTSNALLLGIRGATEAMKRCANDWSEDTLPFDPKYVFSDTTKHRLASSYSEVYTLAGSHARDSSTIAAGSPFIFPNRQPGNDEGGWTRITNDPGLLGTLIDVAARATMKPYFVGQKEGVAPFNTKWDQLLVPSTSEQLESIGGHDGSEANKVRFNRR